MKPLPVITWHVIILNTAKTFLTCTICASTLMLQTLRGKSASFMSVESTNIFTVFIENVSFTCKILSLKRKVNVDFYQMKWLTFSDVCRSHCLHSHVPCESHTQLAEGKLILFIPFPSLLLCSLLFLNGMPLPKPDISLTCLISLLILPILC